MLLRILLTRDRYPTLAKGGERSSVALVKALNDAIAAHPVLAKVSSR